MKTHYKMTMLIFSLLLTTNCSLLFAQNVKKDKNKDMVTIEDIQPVCPNLEKEKKPRVTVANFKLTAPNAPKDQFGENLATMLTNALQKVQCFRVLERLADMGDIQAELNYQQNSGNINKKNTVAKGNMMGANVIVQGEVTEFEQTATGVGVTLVKTKTYKAKVGIIIRLIDPATREVIETESFNVEKKTASGVQVGVTMPYGLGSLNLTSTAFQNPAVQDATEDCIIKATQYIASQKDKIDMPENDVPDGASQYTLTFKNIDYSQLNKVVSAIEKIPGVSDVNSDDFTDNIANMVITQNIKLKEVVDKLISSNTGVKLSVSGMAKDGAIFTVR